jgi:hypothetical protein
LVYKNGKCMSEKTYPINVYVHSVGLISCGKYGRLFWREKPFTPIFQAAYLKKSKA